MRRVDLSFFNKNLVSNLYLIKCVNLNLVYKSYCIPSLTSLHLVFFINNLTDFDHLCSSNYIYLFKYFFRSKASVCQYTSKFHLGVWYYSFQIRAYLLNFKIFFTLYFLLNDIMPKIGKDFSVKIWKNRYMLTIFDLNIFLDWNTSIGLFYLDHNLNFIFVFNGGYFYSSAQLLSMFKIDLI
jgi:hypothetical protein